MKHKPRKPTDVNIIRSILLNINEHETVCANDYQIERDRFIALVNAVIRCGIVARSAENDAFENTSALCIADPVMFAEWTSNIYRKIKQFIVPLLSIIPAVFQAVIRDDI